MKNSFLFILTMVFGLSIVNAQDEVTTGGFAKGDFYASGSIGFGTQNSPGDFKDNAFTIMPAFGYFVSDNIAIGAELGLMTNKSKSGSTTTSNVNQFSAGVYGKYYFTPANQFSFFTKLGVGTFSWEDKEVSNSKVNGFEVAFVPGINYFLSNCIALQASIGTLGYSTSKPDVSGAESTDTFGFNLNLKDINFGVVYNF